MLKYKEETQAKGEKASKASKEVVKHPQFLYLMDHIPNLMKQPNFSSHIKMERLTEIVLKHFQDFQSDESGKETRAIIFSQYRESVEEIVAHLNKHQPLVRVMSFVGQSAGAKGKKGLTQKEQLQVISRFQSGGYNVLVSTSIGEEGLDIGQVDLIICYDSQNSPIRMLQRMGRTGRKRKGRVVLLLTQGKEEDSYKKSQSQYKSVQVIFFFMRNLIEHILMFEP
jgi:Fanconi anemia group M protein